MYESKVETGAICDKCNKEITFTSEYNIYDHHYAIRFGDQYPEGGFGEVFKMELCENCAHEMIGFLKENGYNIREEEWDT
jgi:hypothetical protein